MIASFIGHLRDPGFEFFQSLPHATQLDDGPRRVGGDIEEFFLVHLQHLADVDDLELLRFTRSVVLLRTDAIRADACTRGSDDSFDCVS
jgi:hypothetical protein